VAGRIERLVSKTGLAVEAKATLADLRLKLARHILIGEFVLDLKGQRPASVALVNAPRNVEQERVLRQTAEALRTHHADAYAATADHVRKNFSLNLPRFRPSCLGASTPSGLKITHY